MTSNDVRQTRLFRIWKEMRSRCRRRDGYKHLSVCEAWDEFEEFREWAMDSGYSDELEIDRRNNELGYSPQNCRWATRQQQTHNRRPVNGSTSKYKGVSFNRRSRPRPWRSSITANGKSKHLGCFATEEDAARAYDAAAKKLHGDFACLNFKENRNDE